MKNTKKTTISALLAALATVFMLLSYFPYLTYAIPAIAGLFIMVLVIELDSKWAVGAYISSAFLVFLLAEPESKLLYICFFGYYPILKAIIERINKPIIEWVIKIILFNAAVLIAYFLIASLFGIPTDSITALGIYGAIILLLMANAVFIIYDIAVSKMAMWYMSIFHYKIQRFLK